MTSPGAEPTPTAAPVETPPDEQAAAYLVASPSGVVEILEDGSTRPLTETAAPVTSALIPSSGAP